MGENKGVYCMNGFDTHSQYILGNLDRAITENWILAYYMPIVRASNGRVCEEEALARWIDPDQGVLSPADFIPVLENAKLIYKLDLHIVDEVLKKMKAQTDAGLYLVPISVNLSRTDFDSCDIVEEICERVDKAEIPRNKLIIEITESILGEDFDYMKSQIERFQSLGFSVWMDDFGSGYSSVDVLQDISFDHIKFDIKFMQRFDKEKSRIMLTELIRMAMALGIKTITEGVETEEQVEFLREIGCNKLQGFYFCKPISLEELLDRYKSGRQIGFENPEESAYYDAIGGVNLYDLSIISVDHDGRNQFRRYFDSLPIVIYEADDTGYRIVRCNSSYRSFEDRYFESVHVGHMFKYSDYETGPASVYSKSVKEAAETGERIFFTETLPDNTVMRAVVRRISVNKIKNVSAVVMVILEIVEESAG
ncbi:MAG: EAL domain-containing protein, partial [Lachnospiraceae bacterium]|nr:EAL domain-containing protein [Lachnospiraceae bacterium]